MPAWPRPRYPSRALPGSGACSAPTLCLPGSEKKLKARVQELVSALERLTKSSEVRHQQSAEFVNDLKRANR